MCGWAWFELNATMPLAARRMGIICPLLREGRLTKARRQLTWRALVLQERSARVGGGEKAVAMIVWLQSRSAAELQQLASRHAMPAVQQRRC